MVDMVSRKSWNIFTLVFFSLVLADIIALNVFSEPGVFTADNFALHILLKPLILVSAICFLLKYLKQKQHHNWLLVAFMYSFLGDIVLLGQSINSLFFIGGLALFFLAQVAYIIYFYQSAEKLIYCNRVILGLQAAITVYAIGFYILMLPNLGNLWMPVLFYLIVIALMGLVSLGRFGRVNYNAFFYSVIGALVFIFCSSLIGYHKFIVEIPYANIFIMLTYSIAQYLILKGFVTLRTQKMPSKALINA